MNGKPIVGNHAIENAAIDWVMELERLAGRQPVDRRYDAAFGGDIWSDPFTIEVKAIGGPARWYGLPLEARQVDAAEADPEHFVLDVVDNVAQGDPRAFGHRRFIGEQLQRLLATKKMRTYYEVALPVSEYDLAPQHPSLAHGPVEVGDRRPQWAIALGATRVSLTRVLLPDGEVLLPTARVEFRRHPGPKLTWNETYGKSQIVGSGDLPSCAEVEIVAALRLAGWEAHWIDTFGKAPARWQDSITVPQALPEPVRSTFLAIDAAVARTGTVTGGRWDIVAWMDDALVYLESKGAGDKIRPGQVAWLDAALQAGAGPESFWIIDYVVVA